MSVFLFSGLWNDRTALQNCGTESSSHWTAPRNNWTTSWNDWTDLWNDCITLCSRSTKIGKNAEARTK